VVVFVHTFYSKTVVFIYNIFVFLVLHSFFITSFIVYYSIIVLFCISNSSLGTSFSNRLLEFLCSHSHIMPFSKV
jgi:hypothetical protein